MTKKNATHDTTLAHAVLASWVYRQSVYFDGVEFADIITTPDSLVGGYIKQLDGVEEFRDFVDSYAFNKAKADILILNMIDVSVHARYDTIENEAWIPPHVKYDHVEKETVFSDEYNHIYEITKIIENS